MPTVCNSPVPILLSSLTSLAYILMSWVTSGLPPSNFVPNWSVDYFPASPASYSFCWPFPTLLKIQSPRWPTFRRSTAVLWAFLRNTVAMLVLSQLDRWKSQPIRELRINILVNNWIQYVILTVQQRFLLSPPIPGQWLHAIHGSCTMPQGCCSGVDHSRFLWS